MVSSTIVSLYAKPLSPLRRAPQHSSFFNSCSSATTVPFRRRPNALLLLSRRKILLIHASYNGNSIANLASRAYQKARIPTRLRRARARGRIVMGGYGDDVDEDDDESEGEEDDEDRSLDLLIRFVENVFRKVSRKARRAVKSVLPVPISAKLVGFAVNGTIILTFMWILRAFLEVICTLGSVVFASILLIRGIWTGISYFQYSRAYRADADEPQSWTTARPAT